MKGSFTPVPIKLDIRPVNIINRDKTSLMLNRELREIANEHIYNKKVIPLTNISVKFQEMSKTDFLIFYNRQYGLVDMGDDVELALPYYEYANEFNFSPEIFSKLKRVRYENIETYIPEKYDEYLTSLYGDYMKLPEESQRVPAQYEYFPISKTTQYVANIIRNPKNSYFLNLFVYIKLHGLIKFCKILKERL